MRLITIQPPHRSGVLKRSNILLQSGLSLWPGTRVSLRLRPEVRVGDVQASSWSVDLVFSNGPQTKLVLTTDQVIGMPDIPRVAVGVREVLEYLSTDQAERLSEVLVKSAAYGAVLTVRYNDQNKDENDSDPETQGENQVFNEDELDGYDENDDFEEDEEVVEDDEEDIPPLVVRMEVTILEKVFAIQDTNIDEIAAFIRLMD